MLMFLRQRVVSQTLLHRRYSVRPYLVPWYLVWGYLMRTTSLFDLG